MKYCTHCGAELDDAAVVCVKCGCAVENKAKVEDSSSSTMLLIAFILMIISCVSVGWTLIPLAWLIPMTIKISNARKTGEPLSTGFKICTLLFGNLIAGILLLCIPDNN